MFEWLETTAPAIWVGESLWGYPIMLGLHAVGLAIVVGIFVMLDLRLLGIIRGVSFDAFLSLFRLAWIGLVVNAVSGTALFTSQATVFVDSTPFLLKISGVVGGVIVGILLQRQLAQNAGAWDGGGKVGAQATVLALLSLVCWIGAIFAGRLIAYL